MSVYTELTTQDMEQILSTYQLGQLVAYEGITAGIENSNFFIDVRLGQQTTRYVLTIFERMDADELPYFMRLMRHLADKGLRCPDVMLRRDNSLLFEYQQGQDVKSGCIVSCLSGKTLDYLNEKQLEASGKAMATLHMAGVGFPEQRQNPTGITWLEETITSVLPKVQKHYGGAAYQLLQQALLEQQQQSFATLPSGVIHGDLFVDNILFDGDNVSGIIDFYYAHHAAFAMDIAIALNAQAVLLADSDIQRMQVFLNGYQQVRPLQQSEKDALPALLRLAALRFWVSRLYDALFPRGGSLTQTKDPEEYHAKLRFALALDSV